MAKISFTGFYPSRPFWAVSELNFQVPRIERWFHDQMSEEVYSNETQAYAIKICRDGRILIRITRLERSAPSTAPRRIEDTARLWGEYFDYLNTFYLLLDSSTIETAGFAYFNLHEITVRDVFRVVYEDGKSSGESVAIDSLSGAFQMKRYLSSYGSEIQVGRDPTILMRRVIPLNAISHAESQFQRAVSSGAEKPLASLAKSIAEYKAGNYETSLVFAWFIIEAAINSLWNSHLDALNRDLSGIKRINSRRWDFLKGRDLPVSVVSNMLELFDVIDYELFEDVDSVRGFRNKIVHPTKFTPGATEAGLAINTAVSMIQRLWGLRLTPSLGYFMPGL